MALSATCDLSVHHVNYLAHALLSQSGDLELLGNLAGDHVKGRLEGTALHPRLVAGVRRHRRVDALCDGHPRVCELRALFPDGTRRFAGIVLDVVFDHLLTVYWQRYCRTSLPSFRGGAYAAIERHRAMLPGEFATLGPRWASLDWLAAYETRQGTRAVLERLALRLRRPLPLVEMLAFLDQRQVAVERAFLALFDTLVAAVADDCRADLHCAGDA
jgi:acyl carrier protein phosphodiesterase